MPELDRDTGPWFQTFTGAKVNPMTLEPEDVRLEDVAHALSLICRFNGHCNRHYSVAQHSVAGAHVALSSGYWHTEHEHDDRRDLALWFLIHDAAEAYLQDLPRPVKYADKFFPDADWAVGFREVEHHVQEVCNLSLLGIRQPSQEIEDDLRKLDDAMLATERHQLMGNPEIEWDFLPPPLSGNFPVWHPAQAEKHFLSLFRELSQA